MATADTSVVRVLDVLLVTVPDRLTDNDIDDLQADILSAIDAEQPRAVILDISGVRTMDSFFARVIAETADMIALMGGETIVVGMRPAVAITTAELGFDLGSVETARNTDHAMEMLGIHAEHRQEDEQGSEADTEDGT